LSRDIAPEGRALAMVVAVVLDGKPALWICQVDPGDKTAGSVGHVELDERTGQSGEHDHQPRTRLHRRRDLGSRAPHPAAEATQRPGTT
jgi:hypothetical protein